MKELYRLISSSKGISRAKLSRLTSLSKTTVSTLIDELVMNGFVTDKGATNTTAQGRKPNRLVISSNGKGVMVFNWLAKEIEGRIITLNGVTIASTHKLLEEKSDYVDETQEMYESFMEQQGNTIEILGLCIISPSTIRPDTGNIVSTILPLSPFRPVVHELRNRIPKVALAFFNDTACFGYNETLYMQAMETEPVLFLNLNKGIGAVLFSEGKMVGGANGNTTEFGHFSVIRNGEACHCGNFGCLENYAGEAALNKRAKDLELFSSGKLPQSILYEDVGSGMEQGDGGYTKLGEDIVDNLAYGLGNFITVHNVKHVVIGGKGQYLGRKFYDLLKTELSRNGFQGFVSGVELHFSQQDPNEKTEFAGAAKYYMEQNYSFVSPMEDQIFLG